jgi:hypothetical protein
MDFMLEISNNNFGVLTITPLYSDGLLCNAWRGSGSLGISIGHLIGHGVVLCFPTIAQGKSYCISKVDSQLFYVGHCRAGVPFSNVVL